MVQYQQQDQVWPVNAGVAKHRTHTVSTWMGQRTIAEIRIATPEGHGATLCHPARHGNIATFLYVVCIIVVLHYVSPQDMGILRHSYMWYVLL